MTHDCAPPDIVPGLRYSRRFCARAAAQEQQARYTLDNFADREYGEWYNTIGPDGRISGHKANEWKAPYHSARACLEVIRRMREN
jgi:mannose/cellobiose epimerase-like protein (N-acyl-D-glucosamine 2-epimerase family)